MKIQQIFEGQVYLANVFLPDYPFEYILSALLCNLVSVEVPLDPHVICNWCPL